MSMKEFDINIEETHFLCRVLLEENGVEIVGFRGNSARVCVPERVNDQDKEYLVKRIGKKAFLGNRVMRNIVLPETVEWIGDWAFAQCEQLEKVQISSRGFVMGTGVFTDCKRVEAITIGSDEVDALSQLLATTIEKMPSEDLLRDPEVGNSYWFQRWDLRLQSFLTESDDDGYTDLVLCGEEDIQRSETEFAGDKRKRKAGLCMCRLINDDMLDHESRQMYQNYLVARTKGCESEAAWEYIVQEHGNDISFYRRFGEFGCITQENIDSMIQDLGAENAEGKAFLLQYKRERFSTENVFDTFSL